MQNKAIAVPKIPNATPCHFTLLPTSICGMLGPTEGPSVVGWADSFMAPVGTPEAPVGLIVDVSKATIFDSDRYIEGIRLGLSRGANDRKGMGTDKDILVGTAVGVREVLRIGLPVGESDGALVGS
jgi:hypothetical protein